MPDILYKCDRRACQTCHSSHMCEHTLDINHAVDFEKVGEAYIQRNKPEVIALKLTTCIRPVDAEKLRKKLLSEYKEGIILLPPHVISISVIDSGKTYTITEDSHE